IISAVTLHLAHSTFFFTDTATTEIYTLSLHDALPICRIGRPRARLYSWKRARRLEIEKTQTSAPSGRLLICDRVEEIMTRSARIGLTTALLLGGVTFAMAQYGPPIGTNSSCGSFAMFAAILRASTASPLSAGKITSHRGPLTLPSFS